MGTKVISISNRAPAIPVDLGRHMRKTRGGKIRTGVRSKSGTVLKLTMFVLAALTIYGFYTFDYGTINFADAVSRTLENIRIMFSRPQLRFNTYSGIAIQLLITLSLGVLATIFGAIIAFFAALLSAKNIANAKVANVIKGIFAAVRAVPSILWILIFTVGAGLGGTAAVAGLTLHSAAYLVKAYAESIEEMDSGPIEALRASGAGFWQIVFQAVIPASISYMTAWTFLRFEINFINAIAMGAAAGAGGIGFDLFMAGSFYFDLRELGFITYLIIAAVIILELLATKIKRSVK